MLSFSWSWWWRQQRARMSREAMNEANAVELELLRARIERLDPARRPRYLPHERLRILLYRARYSASLAALARRFVLSVETIKEWIAEVGGGVEKRVKTAKPVNKLPDAVKEIAVLLRWEQLHWGCKRIADVLRRMKLKISRTSIQRIFRRNPRKPAHLISDHGSQFTAGRFQAMLRRRGIRHRFGAVGTHGSISLIEKTQPQCMRRENQPWSWPSSAPASSTPPLFLRQLCVSSLLQHRANPARPVLFRIGLR